MEFKILSNDNWIISVQLFRPNYSNIRRIRPNTEKYIYKSQSFSFNIHLVCEEVVSQRLVQAADQEKSDKTREGVHLTLL